MNPTLQLDAVGTLMALHREAFPLQANDELTRQLQRVTRQAKATGSLTQGTRDAMVESLRKYFRKASADKIDQFTDEARRIVERTLKTEEEIRPDAELPVTVGTGTAEARTALTEFLEDETGVGVAERMNVDFFVRIAREVAQGATQHIVMNMDPVRVDEFPALELVRTYDRAVPRGERFVHGMFVDDEDNGWPARWEAAGGTLVDGRMVALKSDGVWQALGDGAGGYEDTLGNPFAPFAFQSGMGTEEISRDEAVELGLIGEDEEAQPAELDMNELVALPTEAKFARWSRALSASAKLDAGGSNAKRGCLMAMVDDGLADRLLAFAARNIPFASQTGDGIENEPHVTALYGFDPDFDVDDLKDWCGTVGPMTATLGKVSRFDCEEYDVLKVDVESPDLVAFNAEMARRFDGSITPSEHEYNPHLTLAYVRNGELPELDGADDFDGIAFSVSSLLYSLPKRQGRTMIELSAKNALHAEEAGHEFHGNQWTSGGVKFQQTQQARHRGDEVVHVDVDKVDKAWQQDAGFRVGPDGKGGIGNRYARAKDFIGSGVAVNMSEAVSDKDGKVMFIDGRHRFAVLRDAGHKVVPISVPKESAEQFKKHFGL